MVWLGTLCHKAIHQISFIQLLLLHFTVSEQRTESELVVVKVETEELGDNYRETGGKSIGLKLIPLQYLVDDKSEIMTVDGDYFMEQLSPKIEAEGTQIGEAVNEFDKPSSPTPTVAVPSIENQK